MEDPENPECESEGWLLEKGVKETFAEFLTKMKSLGKTNQVEEGGDAQEAT
ncbi:peripherin-2b [Xyrichtys novacula]|uniref:Peripherin-2b n=1 Tax=Xyrichtys novacula TaxID=13765 RepID=A0AAV1G084_XYRNO|nr:peripherin-2b [Xyrichtys novacula]